MKIYDSTSVTEGHKKKGWRAHLGKEVRLEVLSSFSIGLKEAGVGWPRGSSRAEELGPEQLSA